MNGTANPVSAPAVDSPIPRLGPPTRSDDVSMTEPTRPARTSRPRRRPFTPATDLANRVIFVVLGLAFLGAGIVVLLAGRGVFGDDIADRPVLTTQNRAFAAEHAWFWPVVGVAIGLVVLLALGWLWLQTSTGALAGLYVVDDTFGRVRVHARAFTGAVESDLVATSEARQVRARLLGREKRPLLRVIVTMHQDMDITQLRADIEQIALPHARSALSRADLATEVQLIPGPSHGGRVH